ncbi:MAG: type II toxin-antitoxin system RelE/ParE family toxin [Alphaproteobacteria bacterium]|nr:type II toxin-antitoxin system RelE/ParE family toxin [Alphaproteobacteria bacterium]
MLELKLAKDAEKFLLRLPTKHGNQIARKIQMLRENPHQQDAEKLRGYPYQRVDSGEYRIIYEIAGAVLYVLIIGKRNDDEVYNRLKRKFSS